MYDFTRPTGVTAPHSQRNVFAAQDRHSAFTTTIGVVTMHAVLLASALVVMADAKPTQQEIIGNWGARNGTTTDAYEVLAGFYEVDYSKKLGVTLVIRRKALSGDVVTRTLTGLAEVFDADGKTMVSILLSHERYRHGDKKFDIKLTPIWRIPFYLEKPKYAEGKLVGFTLYYVGPDKLQPWHSERDASFVRLVKTTDK